MFKHLSITGRWLAGIAVGLAAIFTANPAAAITAAEVPQLAYFGAVGNFNTPEFRFYRNGHGQFTGLRSTAAGFRNVENIRWNITAAGAIRVRFNAGLPVESTFVENDPISGELVEVRQREELRSIDLEYQGGGTAGLEPVRYISRFRTSYPDLPNRPPVLSSRLLFGTLVSGDGFGLFSAADLVAKRLSLTLTDPARTSCDGIGGACTPIGETYDVFSFRSDFTGKTGRTERSFTWSLRDFDHRLDLAYENGDTASYRRIGVLGNQANEVAIRVVAADGSLFVSGNPSVVINSSTAFDASTVPGYYNQNGIGDEDNGNGDFILYYAPDGITHQISRFYDDTGTLQVADNATRRWRVVDGVLISERTRNFTAGRFLCDPATDPECYVIDRRTQQLLRREGIRNFVEESRAMFFDVGGVDVNVPVPQYLSHFYDRTETLPPPPAPPVELLRESSRNLALR